MTSKQARIPFGADGAEAETGSLGFDNISHYQVLGERSSGTNYLDTLLAKNLRITPRNQFQWKHGYPITHVLPRNMLSIVSFRDPLDWVASMHRKPWHAPERFWNMPFSEFLRTEWRSEVDDWVIRDDTRELRRLENPLRFAAALLWNHYVRARLNVHRGWVGVSSPVERAAFDLPIQHDLDPVDATPFANVLQLRRAKIRGFLSLRNRHCNYVFVRFEDLRESPEAFVDMLQAQFGLERRGPFQGVDKWMGTLPQNQAGQARAAPQSLSREDHDFIWDNLDHDLEAQLGYSPDSSK